MTKKENRVDYLANYVTHFLTMLERLQVRIPEFEN
jgi:hypothetical protein